LILEIEPAALGNVLQKSIVLRERVGYVENFACQISTDDDRNEFRQRFGGPASARPADQLWSSVQTSKSHMEAALEGKSIRRSWK